MPTIPRRILKIGSDIATGAEAAAGTGKYDHTDRIVVPRIRERREYLVHHLLGIGVELCRAIHGDRRDVSVFHELNLFVAHRLGPSGAMPPSTTSVSPVVPSAKAQKNSVEIGRA